MPKRELLWGLILSPIAYYVGLVGGAFLTPGYSHVTNYASELGAVGAPHAAFFNISAMACGLFGIIGAIGLGHALAALGGRRGWSWLAAGSLVLWGVSVVIAGLFPIPSEMHGAYGLGIAGQLTPLLAWAALRGAPGMERLRGLLLLVFVVSLMLFLIMMGVGGLVTRANVGLWQRANSLFAIGWLAILGWALLRRVSARSAVTT